MEEMADVFAALERAGGEQRSALPTWLATHPSPGERVQHVRARIAALGAPLPERVNRAEFLQQIDGLVYGENPRNGFFRENVFLHPDLRFRVAMPPGWQTQNLSQAVVAVSPEGDAALQLTLAGRADPVAAARQFLAQQGIQAIDTSQERINGLPAALAAFQATTQQGPIGGLVGYIQHGGSTYQLVAYAGLNRFSAHAPVMQRAIQSFAPVTDPGVLDVQPDRIDIVRIPQAMTLAEFHRRYPSEVPLQELALINQVAGPDETLRAGTLVKRVS
jgi:predicted Zn-dependent protease